MDALPLTTIAVGLSIAAITYVLREVAQWLAFRSYVSLKIPHNTSAYQWLEIYLQPRRPAGAAGKDGGARARVLRTRHSSVRHATTKTGRVMYTLARDKESLRTSFKGKWIWIRRCSTPASQPIINVFGNATHAPETYFELSACTRDTNLLHEWLTQVVLPAYRTQQCDVTEIEVLQSGGSWILHGTRVRRDWSSLILEASLQHSLLDDVRKFLSERAQYRARHIPYRRSFLIHGPPGTGKTSLAEALAGELQVPLRVLHVNGRDMNDTTLARALRGPWDDSHRADDGDDDGAASPPVSVVLLDDFDPRLDDPKSKLSLAGILGALDGPLAGENLILIFATNSAERLTQHEALVRPGRIDRMIYLGPPTEEQVERFFRKFYPDAPPAVAAAYAARQHAAGPTVSMAALQEHFLQHPALPADGLTPVLPILGKEKMA